VNPSQEIYGGIGATLVTRYIYILLHSPHLLRSDTQKHENLKKD